MQSIEVDLPIQSELSVIGQSNELVLHVLTRSPVKSLVVYKYTGITEFTPFFASSTAMPEGAKRMSVIDSKVVKLLSISIPASGYWVIEAIMY